MPAGEKPAKLSRNERQLCLMMPEELAVEFLEFCDRHHRRKTDEGLRAIRLLLSEENKKKSKAA